MSPEHQKITDELIEKYDELFAFIEWGDKFGFSKEADDAFYKWYEINKDKIPRLPMVYNN